MSWFSRVANVIRSAKLDRALAEELSFHIEARADELVASGMPRGAAEAQARRQFGNALHVRELSRDVTLMSPLDDFVRDVRHGLRALPRGPVFASVVILTLSLGIGANAAVFSVVNAVLMRPLPYSTPDALVSVTRTNAGTGRWISLLRWEAMRKARSFDVGVYRAAFEDVILAGREPEVLRGARMSANVLDILGVRPITGRGFLLDEDQQSGPPVALISERLWTRRFSRASSVVGTSITMNARPVTIIGVLAQTFHFPLRDVDVWFPRPSAIAVLPAQYQACCSPLMGVARLRNGISREQAAAELSVLNRVYESDSRRLDSGSAVLRPLKDDLVGPVDKMLWMLMAAVAFVLLIACANVATLLMARAKSRSREFSLRAALGATRWRVLQQLITESLLLTALGSLLGLGLARAAVRAVTTTELFALPRASEIAVDATVLGWTMVATCVTAVLFGTVPSLQLLKPGLMAGLRQTGTSASKPEGRRGLIGVDTRSALAITQVALSLILLIGAALMAQTIARLSRVDPGFLSAGLLTMRVPLPVATYDNAEKRAIFFDELVRQVRSVPGVRDAAITRAMPTTGVGLRTNFQIDSQRIPGPGHTGQVHTVTPGYFETIGLALKHGRVFDSRDDDHSATPVAVVNERFVRRFWPAYPARSVPLGERLFVPVASLSLFEIVGVVADVRDGGQATEPSEQIYVLNRFFPPQTGYLAVRTAGSSLATVGGIRAAVRAIDPNQSITDIATMDDLLERSTGQQHLAARILGAFAVVALVLALIGLYGLLSYNVTQRTQEISIRRALGAGNAEVIWMVCGPSLRVTLIGIAFGLAGAYAWTNLLKSLLFEVGTTDFVTFIAVSVTFTLVACLASVPPAWRALKLDPNLILRVT
jgi:predicted permease